MTVDRTGRAAMPGRHWYWVAGAVGVTGAVVFVVFLFNGISGMGFVNTPGWRRAQIPSTNGHGTARAVSAVYQAVLKGPPGGRARWIGSEVLAEACRAQSDGVDRVLSRPSRFGLGFQLPQETRAIGPNPEAFGHFGYGGTLGFADPAAGVAFAFLTNKPGDRWQTPRTQRLIESLYASLG